MAQGVLDLNQSPIFNALYNQVQSLASQYPGNTNNTVWTGTMTLNGSAIATAVTLGGYASLTGAAFTGSVSFGDSNFKLTDFPGGSQPYVELLFDVGDGLTYRRDINQHEFFVSGNPMFTIDAVTTRVVNAFNLNLVSTYADNTAAVAGGLIAGDVYKTSTGQLMVVF